MGKQLPRDAIEARNARWVADFQAGMTIGEIGTRDGYTRAMVHVVMKRAGLDRRDGGVMQKKRDRVAREDRVRREKRAHKIAETGRLPGVNKQTVGNTYRVYLGSRYLGNYPDVASANAARLRAELTIDEVTP